MKKGDREVFKSYGDALKDNEEAIEKSCRAMGILVI